MSRLKIGTDGKTAYGRRTGRIWNRPLILFGERCLFRPSPSQSEKNLDRGTYRPRVEYGRLVGIRGRSNDMLLMTAKGVMRGTALHGRPEEERWTTEGWEKLC
eukprot:2376593-Karenia_brevis.AAC.1